jgi:hypothetical protein
MRIKSPDVDTSHQRANRCRLDGAGSKAPLASEREAVLPGFTVIVIPSKACWVFRFTMVPEMLADPCAYMDDADAIRRIIVAVNTFNIFTFLMFSYGCGKVNRPGAE